MTGPLDISQLRAWNTDGYLVLPGVLSSAQVLSLRRDVDRLRKRSKEKRPGVRRKAGLDQRNILSSSPRFVELIDPTPVFDIALQLLGPYIQLSMAQAIIRAPDRRNTGYVHTDGGQAMSRLRVTETSAPLQVKVQYFLTGVRGTDRGNFVVFPGSHLRPFPLEGDRPTPRTPGTVQLEVKAGDAAIFPHALWHGVAPNRGNRARKSLIYCYSHQCFRQFDFGGMDQDVLDGCTPRQRRLLGDLGKDWKPGAYFYGPADQLEVMKGSP